MAVNFKPTDATALHAIEGVRIGVAAAGVKKVNHNDLTVMLLDEGTSVAGVFTTNRFCAAPVQICQKNLNGAPNIRALVINTGNANAGTGADGLQRAEHICSTVAQQRGIAQAQVLPFSTGVIMETLPSEKIIAGIPAAISNAQAANWGEAAKAIMTTDTVPKAYSKEVSINGKSIKITGISKGAGMIRPNMATMLGYMATDCAIPQGMMQVLATRLADQSFNCISIDGDTSTNDSFIVMATNKVDVGLDHWDSATGKQVLSALMEVAQWLAHAIVRDGEGATKFIEVRVGGGKSYAECKQVAYAIAHSPLVKTAFFASDPNLGRILAAVGYAGIADLDQSKIELHLGDVLVAQNGGRASSYQEADGQRVMAMSEIVVRVDLGRGDATGSVWTCDLSHDYVSINADYRS